MDEPCTNHPTRRVVLDTCHLEITCPASLTRSQRDRALVEIEPHLQRFLSGLARDLVDRVPEVGRHLLVSTDHDDGLVS